MFAKEIVPALEDVGIRFADWDDLDDDDRAYLDEHVRRARSSRCSRRSPSTRPPVPVHLEPVAQPRRHRARPVDAASERFARVKVPPLLPRFVVLPDGERFVPLEQVIAAHLDALFPGMEILAHHPFRVTRDADFELEDEAEDLLEAIESVLRRRSSSAASCASRSTRTMTDEVLELLCRELELVRRRRQRDRRPARPRRPLGALRARPARAQGRALGAADARSCSQGSDAAPDFFRAARRRPTCSCTTPTTRSPRRSRSSSSRPPATRTCSRSSRRSTAPRATRARSSRSLIRAAEQGKQVVALVELKARFDEQANIDRARVLEEAGVHVVYGLVGLKTHAKVLLVVRQEADGIRRYCHIGTGNYNPKTAHLYEDLGLLTADPELGADLTDLFNYLTGYSRQGDYRKLLVAPVAPAPGDRRPHRAARPSSGAERPHHDEDEQPRRPGDDRRAVRRVAARHADRPASSAASAACARRARAVGERSACARSSAASSSTRASTASAPIPTTAEYLIGSADLMPRNLDRRVEALAPVTDPRLRARLEEILDIDLADDDAGVGARRRRHAGSKIPTVAGVSTHRALQELAVARARSS